MSKIKVGETYKDGYGQEYKMEYFDSHSCRFVGHSSNETCLRWFCDNGRRYGTTDDRFNLIIPPQLPPLQMRAGRCKARNGRECIASFNGQDAFPWTWKIYNPQRRTNWTVDDTGAQSEDHETQWDIVELLDDPKPEQKPDPMKRFVTLSELDAILREGGYPSEGATRSLLRKLAESQP